MCGIAGYIGQAEPGILDEMLHRLVHRGPDDKGIYRGSGIALGARRLRVIDLLNGGQPKTNESKRIHVVLNGEIYNHRELQVELTNKGHHFVSRCDTEVLVHLYEEEGESFVHRLQGMFALALWDQEQQKLLLVRDRLGIKSLYVAPEEVGLDGNPLLLFSSELPSLLAVLSRHSINRHALAAYFSKLYIPGPETIYDEVVQLGPGEILKIQGGRRESWQYYRLDNEVTRDSSPPAMNRPEAFRTLLRDTVRSHLISDKPIGLLLSGGLDSASILAMMHQEMSEPINTFSIGYEPKADRAFNEIETARLLAEHFGTVHHTELVNPDVVQLLPKIIESMGEPFADSSSIPTYLISKIASQSVTVGLSGIGGDELFGGYPRYLGMHVAKQYSRFPVSLRKWMGRNVAFGLRDSADNQNRWGRVKRFMQDGDLSLADQYLSWTTFIPTEWGRSAFTKDFQDDAGFDYCEQAYREKFNRWPSKEPADQAMGLDLQTYLPDDLLRMADRLSMAHSLELRVPFCDHHLLALARTIPASVRLSRWKLKSFMRTALEPVIPSSILKRPKYGFQVPMARWLRDDLREMVHDYVSEKAIKEHEILNPKYVRWLLDQHESGARNFSDQVYGLLIYEMWKEKLKEQSQGQLLSRESFVS